jgi:hypothetical protein
VPFEKATYCSHRKVYRPTWDTFHNPLSLSLITADIFLLFSGACTEHELMPQMRRSCEPKAATSYCCTLHAWLIDGHKQFYDADPTATDPVLICFLYFFSSWSEGRTVPSRNYWNSTFCSWWTVPESQFSPPQCMEWKPPSRLETEQRRYTSLRTSDVRTVRWGLGLGGQRSWR